MRHESHGAGNALGVRRLTYRVLKVGRFSMLEVNVPRMLLSGNILVPGTHALSGTHCDANALACSASIRTGAQRCRCHHNPRRQTGSSCPSPSSLPHASTAAQRCPRTAREARLTDRGHGPLAWGQTHVPLAVRVTPPSPNVLRLQRPAAGTLAGLPARGACAVGTPHSPPH